MELTSLLLGVILGISVTEIWNVLRATLMRL